jgi:hypothetical protein
MVLGLVFCLADFAVQAASVLLKMERSAALLGPWAEVPADNLSILYGGLVDNVESGSAFYRLQVAPWDAAVPPVSLALDEVPARVRKIAQEHLDRLRDVEEDSSWKSAVLMPQVHPFYDPAVAGAAYMEFKVGLADPRPTPGGPWPPATDCGYILASVNEDDFPIVEYATSGPTPTEMLQRLAGSQAIWVIRYEDGFLAAENEAGELVAYLGNFPGRYPDAALLPYVDLVFEGFVDANGETEPPGQPEFVAQTYARYAEFKADYLASSMVQMGREQRRLRAELEWAAVLGTIEQDMVHATVGLTLSVFESLSVTNFTVANRKLATIETPRLGLRVTGLEVGSTQLRVQFRSGETFDGVLLVSEDGPDPGETGKAGWTSWTEHYAGNWGHQRQYVQIPMDSYWSGCGPTAWAMLYGWFDYRGLAPELIGAIEFVAPLHQTPDVNECMLYVRDATDTYHVAGTTMSATNPWRMDDGVDWAAFRMAGRDFSDAWSLPGVPKAKCRRKASDSILGQRPAIIGLGWYLSTAHYCVAYGYRYRDFIGFWGSVLWRERWFKCNLGNGTTSPVWKNAAQVWYGTDADFWHIL